MDDLSGLDWSSSTAANSAKAPATNASSSFYPALRPTPSPFTSGRNTPLSSQASGAQAFKPPPNKSAAQDSFSNLVHFGSSKPAANLSLREQQERLEAEKRRKDDHLRRQAQANFGDGRFLDNLGQSSASASRTASPAIPSSLGTSPAQNGARDASDDDLFSAFNANTKVDNASYYPPPAAQLPSSGKNSPANAPHLDLRQARAWDKPTGAEGGDIAGDDDDDPFGLNQLKSKRSAPISAGSGEDDDDLLGDLAKPVDQVRLAQAVAPKAEPGQPIEGSDSESADEQTQESTDPFDQAVAQLVDYGFTPENARRGLTESGAGLNVQAAANWLLDDAHRQAKEKAKGKSGQSDGVRRGDERSTERRWNESPAWQAGELRRSANRSPAVSDGDFSKTASAVGSNLLKTANTLWKSGQKRVQKAVADFQQDGSDAGQPKWMRSATAPQGSMPETKRAQADVTDEAIMLESGTRPGRKQAPAQASMRTASPASSMPAPSRDPVAKWQQGGQPTPPLDARSRITKQAVEEQSASAYVSPARRRRPQPQAPREPEPPKEEEPALLGLGDSPALPSRPLPERQTRSPAPNPAAPSPAPTRSSVSPRPPPPTRQIPSVSPVALQTSTKYRVDGTEQFKRGDYAAAHAAYTSSIAALPKTHPLVILLLCNRALTALKTGEPRQAVDDADAAIALIGPSRGEGESVEIISSSSTTTTNGAEKRDMRELYRKALTRKAEALEQMEKWADAGAAWQACVEAGVGGPTAIAGRQRCQTALAPKPKKPATPAARATLPPSTARTRPPARAKVAASAPSQSRTEAVERLRAANKAAEREGDEKIALVDKVDARIAAWRDGKRDNLRALLGSMEAVLWEGSGWKKVGLHELVMANRVKIVYMKAIAKTHPDKLAQDSSTEVRMIAGTVFSTLNEAWDKFKAENGL